MSTGNEYTYEIANREDMSSQLAISYVYSLA
jgi:hypothetical protein